MQDDLRSDLASLKRLKTDSELFTNLYTEINKEAEMLFPIPENLAAQNKSITLNYDDNGVPATLTTDYKTLNEIFNSDKFQDYVYKDFDSEGPDDIPSWNYEKAMGPDSKLNAAEKAIFEQIFYPGYKDRGGWYGVTGNSGSPLYDEIIGYTENEPLQRALGKITEQRNSFMADELRKTNLIPQAVAYSIPLNNTAQKEQFKGLLGGIAIDMEQGKVDEALMGGSKVAADIRGAMEDFETANVVTAGADGKYKLVLQTPDSEVVIDLSQQQYDKFFLGKFDASPEVQAFDSRILPSMIDTRSPLAQDSQGNYFRPPNAYYTTATDNKYQTTLENAFLHSEAGDFPALRFYKASGNIVSDVNPKTENAMYRLQLNIFDPVSGQIRKNVLWPGMVPKENVAPLLNQITDQVIFELLAGPGAQMSSAQYYQLSQAAQSPNATVDYERFVNEDINQDGKIGR